MISTATKGVSSHSFFSVRNEWICPHNMFWNITLNCECVDEVYATNEKYTIFLIIFTQKEWPNATKRERNTKCVRFVKWRTWAGWCSVWRSQQTGPLGALSAGHSSFHSPLNWGYELAGTGDRTANVRPFKLFKTCSGELLLYCVWQTAEFEIYINTICAYTDTWHCRHPDIVNQTDFPYADGNYKFASEEIVGTSNGQK